MRVLIVDHSAALRQRLRAVFADDATLEVSEAGSVDEALRELALGAVKCVIVDLRVGAESGLQLLRGIKARFEQTRVAILTNDASDTHRRTCLESGADWFFDKSRHFEELVAAVRAYCA